MAQHSDPDCTISSDGSTIEGTTRGEGGTLILLHGGQRTLERLAPADQVCSSTRSELVEKVEALQCVVDLPTASLDLITTILLYSDSRPGLQLISCGAAYQHTAMAQRVWMLLGKITSRGKSVIMQWIPDHRETRRRTDWRTGRQTPAHRRRRQRTCRVPGPPSAASRQEWLSRGQPVTHIHGASPATISGRSRGRGHGPSLRSC